MYRQEFRLLSIPVVGALEERCPPPPAHKKLAQWLAPICEKCCTRSPALKAVNTLDDKARRRLRPCIAIQVKHACGKNMFVRTPSMGGSLTSKPTTIKSMCSCSGLFISSTKSPATASKSYIAAHDTQSFVRRWSYHVSQWPLGHVVRLS
jgi:hypothetical protein